MLNFTFLIDNNIYKKFKYMHENDWRQYEICTRWVNSEEKVNVLMVLQGGYLT